MIQRRKCIRLLLALVGVSISLHVANYCWFMAELECTRRKGCGESEGDILAGSRNNSPSEDPGGIACFEKRQHFRITQRGSFIVLNNYVRSSVEFGCGESVTYATYCEYTSLGNLVILAKRWNGPISVAIQAPVTDFISAMQSIVHLRGCGPRQVVEFVTFHIYFHMENLPFEIPRPREVDDMEADCNALPPYAYLNNFTTYRQRLGIPQARNVGRNVARDNAMTHYILPADIDLLPNPGLIEKFMRLAIRKSTGKLRVFPLPVFELKPGTKTPDSKRELVKMLEEESAQVLRAQFCPSCHVIPNYREWLKAPETADMQVIHVANNKHSFAEWEPVYIGTNEEPYYEERLNWDGTNDKVTQGYIMCLLGYEYQILNNAFMTYSSDEEETKRNEDYVLWKINEKMIVQIYSELSSIFGFREGCKIHKIERNGLMHAHDLETG